MPPRRRDRKTPNPPEEREIPRRRGRKLPDSLGAREMHKMRDRIDAMEITQRCTIGVVDISESESENEVGHGGEEVAAEEHLFRVVARIGAREKMDIPVYEGNLDVEELLD
jgi:hypothetical protein